MRHFQSPMGMAVVLKARYVLSQMQLISPDELLKACQLFTWLRLPVKLVAFPSGMAWPSI